MATHESKVMLCELSPNEIYAKFEKALYTLYMKDYDILQNDANERSVAARLAMYLRDEFESLDDAESCSIKVDVEYNRVGNIENRDAKTTNNGDKVYPDIVIHERGCQYNNLFACEIKKDASDKKAAYKHDADKIKEYIGKLNYRTAAHIYQLNGKGVAMQFYAQCHENETTETIKSFPLLQKVTRYIYDSDTKKLSVCEKFW